jgi:hypothetical protein
MQMGRENALGKHMRQCFRSEIFDPQCGAFEWYTGPATAHPACTILYIVQYSTVLYTSAGSAHPAVSRWMISIGPLLGLGPYEFCNIRYGSESSGERRPQILGSGLPVFKGVGNYKEATAAATVIGL